MIKLNKVAEMATKTIVNNSTLEELNKKIKGLLADLLWYFSWDWSNCNNQ